MIKYIGSKRLLVPSIVNTIAKFSKTRSVLDVFSGTSRVGHALKRCGYRVIANDHNAYSHTLARCYVEADRPDVHEDAVKLIAEFNELSGKPGYFTQTFCCDSRFFHPKNGERIDAIRDAIEAKGLAPDLKSVLLVSLMEAADRVDSTTGLQMAYLKKWAARASNDLELRMPEVLPQARHGKGQTLQLDALELSAHAKADIAYLDPPYNQHKYLGNYHIWETLVLWDRPSVYGIACKREDCRTRSSVFNSKPQCGAALRRLIKELECKVLVVSFNDEGYIDRDAMESMLSSRGQVMVIEQHYKRYVGAQIGIHNPRGEKVGAVSHLHNKEYLFVAGDFEALGSSMASLVPAICAPAVAQN